MRVTNTAPFAIDAKELFSRPTTNVRVIVPRSALAAAGPVWSGVVTTVVGDGTGESRDGVGTSARVASPRGLLISANGKFLIFTETERHRIRRYNLADGRVSTLFGGACGFKFDQSSSAAVTCPDALCVDPLHNNNLYIADLTSIRYWDTASDQVTLIAGDAKDGYADGVGSNARFHNVTGLLCHPNGKTLFVCDRVNHCIRKVDLPSLSVTTIAGDTKKRTRDGTGVQCSIDGPRQIVFDRSPNVKPNSVLLIAAIKSIRRFEQKSWHHPTTLKWSIVQTLHRRII